MKKRKTLNIFLFTFFKKQVDLKNLTFWKKTENWLVRLSYHLQPFSINKIQKAYSRVTQKDCKDDLKLFEYVIGLEKLNVVF